MQQNAALARSSRDRTLPGTIKYFVSVFGVGFIPFASGTWGSAFALLFYLFIPGFWHWYVILPVSVPVFFAAIPAASRAEKVYGDDPSMVVVDEVVGMWITLASPVLPLNWLYAFTGFLLFRLFDIVKPFPANRFDAIKGGFGIMMDDVVSGVYANVLAHILLYGFGLAPLAWEFVRRSL